MLGNKLEEVKRYFERELREAISELSETKIIMSHKDDQINRLTELAHQQERTINVLKGNSVERQQCKV